MNIISNTTVFIFTLHSFTLIILTAATTTTRSDIVDNVIYKFFDNFLL